MNIGSGIILGNSRLIAIIKNNDLCLVNEDGQSRILAKDLRGIRFLTACPSGEYIAFWADTGESFRLIDVTGEAIWSCWMNTDKATPHGIQFSASGDAVAFVYDFEGVHGIFFGDFEKRYTTRFGCSNSPIGHDADLKYFVIDRCNPYEHETLAFYEHDTSREGTLKVPPAIVRAKIKKSPLIVERDRCIHSHPVLSIRDWEGLAVQKGMEGFVILKEGNLHWLTKDSDKPEVIINGCIPQSSKYEWYRCTLTVDHEIALIQSISYGRSIVVNRNYGVVWRGNDLSSTTLSGQRVLAQYSNGAVEVIRSDGSSELKCTPPSGLTMAAADIIDNVLYIVYTPKIGRSLEIKALTLSGKLK